VSLSSFINGLNINDIFSGSAIRKYTCSPRGGSYGRYLYGLHNSGFIKLVNKQKGLYRKKHNIPPMTINVLMRTGINCSKWNLQSRKKYLRMNVYARIKYVKRELIEEKEWRKKKKENNKNFTRFKI
jgi:hypothetical protein